MKGRPRQPLDSHADAQAVRQKLQDKRLAGWQRQRLQAAQLGLAGQLTLPEIAQEIGVHPRTVSTWLEQLRAGGPANSMSKRPRPSARNWRRANGGGRRKPANGSRSK